MPEPAAAAMGAPGVGMNLARVRNVAQRLIPATGVFRSDAPNWNWEVNTLDTKELNAYCMPGGKIMVYSGLVERLDLSDAELAAVIGHDKRRVNFAPEP